MLAQRTCRSISGAYFCATTLRFSFIVGVSSSSSAVSSCSMIRKSLICSTRASFALAVSIFGPDQADDLRRARQARKVGVGNLLVLREFCDVVLIDHDEAGQVVPTIADHDRVGDIGAELQQVLDRRRRDILAAGGDDDVLHPVGDAQIAVIERAAIAGVQPAVFQRLGGLVGHLPVAREHVRPANLDFVCRRRSVLRRRARSRRNSRA